MNISPHFFSTLFDILHTTNILHMDTLTIINKEYRETSRLDYFLNLVLTKIGKHTTLHVQSMSLIYN